MADSSHKLRKFNTYSVRSLHQKPEEKDSKQLKEQDEISQGISNYFDKKQTEINIKREQNFNEWKKENQQLESDLKATKKGFAKSPLKSKLPYKYNKMTDREREYYFMNIYDENDALKKQLKQLKEEIKIINTKYTVLQNQIGIKGDFNGNEDKEALMIENIKLKEKIIALSQAKSVIKGRSCAKRDPLKNLYSTQNIRPQSTHIEQENQKLVKINDALKSQLQKADVQLKAMQDTLTKTQCQPFGNSKLMHEQNITMQVMRQKLEEIENRNKLYQQQLEQYKLNYVNSTKQLTEERQKTNNLETQLRLLQGMNKNLQDYEIETQNLRRERNDLDQKVKDLTQAPFIREHTDQISLKEQIHKLAYDLDQTKQEKKKINDKLILIDTEYNYLVKKHKELEQKYETSEQMRVQAESEMKIKEMNWLKDLEGTNNSQFYQTLGAMRLNQEKPAWQKLDFLDSEKIDINDSKQLIKENEKLIEEKGKLADTIERWETKYRTLTENAQEIQRQDQVEIKSLQMQLEQAQNKISEMEKLANLQTKIEGVHEMQGVKYDGNINDFSIDSLEDEISPEENILDLYLSEAMLDENTIAQLLAEQNQGFIVQNDIKNLLTFLTIDFYNHETVNSSIVEGLNANYACQASFNVQCNQGFLQYLQCGNIGIEIYVSQGLEPFKLGYGSIELNKLIELNKNDGVSAVINTSVTLYDIKDQLLGILQYKMRMRFPIAKQLQWFKEKQQIQQQMDEESVQLVEASQKRTIEIVIEKAQLNVSNKTKSFIFYQFSGKDFPTKVAEGKEPLWNYHYSHIINYGKDFVQFIKNNQLEFIALDDQASIYHSGDEDSDYIGSAHVSLLPLLKNDTINAILEIKGKRGEKKGTLQIKIFWFDKKLFQTPPLEQPDSLITKAFHNELKMKIVAALNERELTLQSAFKMFDTQNNNFIYMNSFINMVINILNIPVMKEQVQQYYKTLPSPMDFVAFENLFGEFLQTEWEYRQVIFFVLFYFFWQSMQFNQQQLKQSKFSENTQRFINRMNENNEEFSSYKFQTIRDQILQIFLKKLETQSEIQIFNELDSNKNQQVSFFELKSYLLKNGMKQINDDDLYSFLNKFDQNRDSQINLKEFFDYLGVEKSQSLQYSQSQYYEPKQQMKSSNESIEKVQRALLNYMKQKRLTFYDMYIQIDKNRNKYVSKEEFKDFLKNRVNIILTENEFKAVWQFFDESPDGKLSVKEFNDSLKKKAWGLDSQKSLLEQQTREISIILQQIKKKMEKEQKSFSILFSEIDKNNDGTISQQELQEYLTKELEISLTYEDFDQLFRRFDANYDDCISITEFKKVFEEEKLKFERNLSMNLNAQLVQSVQLDNNFVKATKIPPTFYDYLQSNSTKIFITFKKLSPNSIWINKQIFHDQLIQEFSIFKSEQFKISPIFAAIELTEIQINNIIGYIQCGNNDLINYEKFIEFFKESGKEDQLYKNMKEDNQTKKLASQTFKRIDRILKQKNISSKQFFQILDLNKDIKIFCVEKLNFFELQQAFNQMQLKIPKYDAEQIFKMIDKNHTGEIQFEEFQQAFLDLTL